MFTIRTRTRCIEISGDVIVILIMLAFTLLYFLQARSLSTRSLLMPRFLYICIAVTGLSSLVKAVRISKLNTVALLTTLPEAPCMEVSRNEPERSEQPLVSKKLLIFTGCCALFTFSLEYLGTTLAILIFLPMIMWILGMHKPLVLILSAITVNAFIYGVFNFWLSVPLPTGLLGF